MPSSHFFGCLKLTCLEGKVTVSDIIPSAKPHQSRSKDRELNVSWENAEELLQTWHSNKNRTLGRNVFGFLETELRLMTPAIVRRSWPEDLVEDCLHMFLVKLLEKPLPKANETFKAYIRKSFANHCIDRYRKDSKERLRSENEFGEWEDPAESPLQTVLNRERYIRVVQALEKLAIKDRVGFKLKFAPAWLNDQELVWLANQGGLDTIAVRNAVLDSEDSYSLSKLFDPGDDDPQDQQARRLRMERFRKSVDRAVEKLKTVLAEDQP